MSVIFRVSRLHTALDVLVHERLQTQLARVQGQAWVGVLLFPARLQLLLARVKLVVKVALNQPPLRPDSGKDRGNVVIAVGLQLHVVPDPWLVGPVVGRFLQSASKVLQLVRHARDDVLWE